MMSEEEILAVHESAHAVFAVLGEWTRLAGPVSLKGPGSGDVVMSTDVGAIARTLAADPGFDRDLPRIRLIEALIAGPIAERLLVEHGRARLSERDLRESARTDYQVIAEQLAELDPPRPGLLERLEHDVRQRLEQPAVRSAVERFAAILIDRRSLGAQEASAIIEAIKAELDPASIPARRIRRVGRRALLAAFLLWEAWWGYELVTAPRPDHDMRIAAALMLGLFLPGLLIAFGATISVGYRAVRGNRCHSPE